MPLQGLARHPLFEAFFGGIKSEVGRGVSRGPGSRLLGHIRAVDLFGNPLAEQWVEI